MFIWDSHSEINKDDTRGTQGHEFYFEKNGVSFPRLVAVDSAGNFLLEDCIRRLGGHFFVIDPRGERIVTIKR